ncbi:MAG: solute:sodium symporter family transporter [Pseudomonadales bacterium]|nr:solute:sodium symporter family transporter [Pseudomonadales bacterium]
MITLISCTFFMALVAWYAYRRTRGQTGSRDGYFLAGHGLTGTFIAGSLLLTNLSAEQLIGLNGSAYAFNLSSMAWEVTAAVAIVVMAMFLLPRYLTGGFTTLPEFLESRFDARVRRATALLFLLGYALVTIPAVLYSGSLAVLALFDVSGLLQLERDQALHVTVWIIGLVGAAYAIFGGLKAVAVSDTLNGAGLLIIGVIVPVLGLVQLGGGSALEGLAILTSEHTHKLNAIGTATDPTPFGTLFTGMILANLFYWGTNQYVIQRTLGASSLAEGQKGVLISGFFKLAVPFLMMFPGIIAFHLYGGGLISMDDAYPTLVRDVLPDYLGGFFLAVLLGAVLSSFNSLLNSASTLFAVDLYQPLRPAASDAELIRVARIIGTLLALFSFIVAPLLQYAPEGLWQLIRRFTGFYNIPIIAIVAIAVLGGRGTHRVPASGALAAIGFHLAAYGILTFVWDSGIHFIHLYALMFICEISIMLWFGWRQPALANSPLQRAVIDMTPWRYARPVSGVLLASMVGLYLVFSRLGLAS